MKPRRRARSLVLEILYEVDIAPHEPMQVLQRRLRDYIEQEDPLSKSAVEFATHLLSGVISHQPTMDTLIVKFAPEWPLDQIAIIDRNILRIAIYEILFDTNTPVKVAINEAVELAKLYGSDSAPRFVNGVLGSFTEQVDELRASILGEPAS